MSKYQPALVKNPPNYRHFGFTLSPRDVSQILGFASLAEVYDRVRTGELAALSTRDDRGEKVLLFHPDEVIAYRADQLARAEQVEGRRLARAVPIVREYLRAHEGVPDFNDAVELGVPVWVATKTGRPALHVRAETIAELFNARDDVQMNQEAPITTSVIEAALAQLGGVRVKGFIALADKGTARQRWSYWWRLPHDIATRDEDAVPDVVPLVRDRGESLIRSGNVVRIDTPLTSRRNDG